ncbi:hypothetical protein [Geodermatophilus amargosae]|uniref:hypothetical protein n=1 Tax=Geodermatophilus amargosae TaxID=1296565 RepID=UPI0034DEC16E
MSVPDGAPPALLSAFEIVEQIGHHRLDPASPQTPGLGASEHEWQARFDEYLLEQRAVLEGIAEWLDERFQRARTGSTVWCGPCVA